jgi:hypothetical protein
MQTALAIEEFNIMVNKAELRFPEVSRPIIILVGGFGSGKTEVSVNLAKYIAGKGKSRVTVADLDLVNPYFRSREVIKELKQFGIDTIAPGGDHFYADLPILLPEIKGIIDKPEGTLIIDVGGDAQGTKALGSLSGEFRPDSFEMLMVLNSRRPATSDLESCLKTMERIEWSSRLNFTGLVSNSHMLDETNADILREGYRLAKAVSKNKKIPLCFVSAMEDILMNMDLSVFSCPVLPLSRLMLKPWER